MSIPRAVRKGNIVEVSTGHWTVQHDARAGGCWTSLVFKHGTGKNLLAAPVSSRVRNLEKNPKSDGSSPFFYESKFEKNPRITIENPTSDAVAVVAEGAYRLNSGEELGVRYRQRYEYREHGLVACELDVTCEGGRDDIVEVLAVELQLREGMTDVHVRENPICAASSDLLGSGRWFKLNSATPAYVSRYVPMHVVCFEKGREGIEFSCSSDIGAWETGFNADPGLGYYEVRPAWTNPKETLISLNPYCVAYRRNPTTLKGTRRVRYYLGIPQINEVSTLGTPYFHTATGSRWLSDADLERVAKSGVKLIRFHNDYREDGPFWHDGMYPPYDPKGMVELKRIVATTHRLGMKIIPYISVKEFHPESPGFKENQLQWRQQPGPTFQELHTWAGSGEFGQTMCLESGWLEFRKKSIEIILNDIPWDGLYFDWCAPHGCRNTQHGGGRLHSDQDAFYDFMFWVRRRVGPDGIIMTHISGLPQIVVENLATISLIYEDQNYGAYPRPEEFPAQCVFIPTVPRMLCAMGSPNTPVARQTIMSGILQGTPGAGGAMGGDAWDPVKGKFGSFNAELLHEMALFHGEDLAAYDFAPATHGVVETGKPDVYAALWTNGNRALIYVGNWSAKSAAGKLKLDPKRLKWKGKAGLKLSHLSKTSALKPAALKCGIPFSLKAWGSALYRIERI
jgi:hypothetical protein